jgi:hypothetical protein
MQRIKKLLPLQRLKISGFWGATVQNGCVHVFNSVAHNI